MGLLVKPDITRRQLATEVPPPVVTPSSSGASGGSGVGGGTTGKSSGGEGTATAPGAAALPCRFHGTVILDAARVGRDASRIADEVIAHLAGLVGAEVRVTLEI